MFFNSLDFAIFLPIVFCLYWFVFNRNLRGQNFLVVVASYVFYGWWDWRFLSLILFSTIIDYIVGLRLSKEIRPKLRGYLLFLSVFVNVGFLGFFKYFNFFIDSFSSAFSFFGGEINPSSLNIILPVGISFYTFQTMSYTIDVYREKLQPTRDFISFSAFVSFFPQLVAGPIERATHLLPQFYKVREFEYDKAVDGLRQILWGLFKKVVIADNCARYANLIFNDSSSYSGSTLLLGAVFFAFQIYGDFSGYSDIAIGCSRLFGFSLMKNFSYPYFSRDIAEFWRRWHISLSTWFRDYIYIPLGGSKAAGWKSIRNIFIIFVVSGLWHGANWTFVVWGLLNALYFIPLLLLKRNRRHQETVASGRVFPTVGEFFSMAVTFGLTIVAWIFFRAENLNHAFSYLSGMISPTLFSLPSVRPATPIFLVFMFLLIEWFGREHPYAIAKLGAGLPRFLRWGMYCCFVMAIIRWGCQQQQFIYFQF